MLLTEHSGIEAHNSPTVAVDPADPANVVVAERIDRPRFSAAVHYSRDGGATWAEAPFPTPRGEDRPYAPDVAWGPDGTVYMTFVTLAGRGNNPDRVWITRSREGGATWAPPAPVTGAYAFQVRLAVDPSGDDLHLTWLQASRHAVGTASFTETGLPILTSTSRDRGESWTEPEQVNASDRERVGAASPVASPDGYLYVAFVDFEDDRFDWENLEGAVYPGTFELVVARRAPGRNSFVEAVVDSGLVPRDRFLVYLPAFPSLAAGSGGLLYAAWSDARNGDADVFVARSEDNGRSWSRPLRANDDDLGNGRDQYLPATAVTSDGRLDIAFYDRRGDPNNVMTELYLTHSRDAARSFAPNVRLSDQAFSSLVGPEHPGEGGDFGTRIAVAGRDARALAVWTDTRHGSVASARQDVYATVVTELPGAGRDFLPAVAAAAAGVLAGVGGALLIAGRSRRRAKAGPPRRN